MNYLQKLFMVIGITAIIHSAHAFNLDEARRQGKVIEQSNGYLVAQDPTLQSEVERINQERKREYERIAREKNVPVAAVEKMAAEEIRKKTKK